MATLIYVSDTPWKDDRPGPTCGAEWFIMWADTEDEAVAAIYGVGGSEDQRRTMVNTLVAYDVTPEQFADMIGMGVKVTDRFGLAYWCAQREERTDFIRRIDAARRTGCV